MKPIKHISLLLIIIFGLWSCSDDFLEVDSRQNIAAEDTEENITSAQFVNGVYGMFTDWPYAFAYLGITEIISDNAIKGSSPTDPGGDKNLLDELTYTSTATSISEMWEHWYKTIGRANYAIAYIQETADENQERLIGEAKFLRALTYFYLVRGFGGVTLQGEVSFVEGEAVVDPEVDLSQRNSAEEVYAYIEKDLTDAIAALPVKSAYPAQDLGRATKGAARTLLSKVYLYQEEFDQALELADAVINSGEYGLEADYAEIWREYTENGVESIFEIQARGQAIAHGVHQYSETQGARGSGGWGWGFNVPSQDLVDAYQAAGDEVRMNATIIFAGETLWDGREVSPSVENPRYNEKAYSSANEGAADGDKNIRVLRLAEIYLIRAEAANELGQTQAAQEALNRVRERVQLDPVSGLSQEALREQIWEERRLELAFEHDRWFDLIRTGQAAEVMQALGLPFDSRHELFPIPEDQLIQTPEMEQNPGW